MKTTLRNRLLIAAVLATTAPLALTSTTALAKAGQAYGQQADQRTDKEKARDKERADREAAVTARKAAQQKQAEAGAHQRQAAATTNQDERQRHLQAAQSARGQQAQAEQRARDKETAANQAARDSARAERQKAQVANQAARTDVRSDRQTAQVANQAARTEARSDRQMAQVKNQAARTDARSDRQDAKRLSKARQEQIIATQKQRVSSYRSWQQSQRTAAAQVAAAIQRQNRTAQYNYIVDYNNRLYAQQQRYATVSYDYYNDPYFYSAPSYRYMRDGAWYTTNQYGVNMLQTAINDGYGEGYRAGQADRMDGWRPDYRSSYVYQNASYGYSGYYMDRGEYAYYFRQGFRRGYEDGYYSRYQYGSYHNGSYSILGAVLNTVLGLQPYHSTY